VEFSQKKQTPQFYANNRRTGRLDHSSAADNEVIIFRSSVAETKINLLHDFFFMLRQPFRIIQRTSWLIICHRRDSTGRSIEREDMPWEQENMPRGRLNEYSGRAQKQPTENAWRSQSADQCDRARTRVAGLTCQQLNVRVGHVRGSPSSMANVQGCAAVFTGIGDA
jgi:hypothetical protein